MNAIAHPSDLRPWMAQADTELVSQLDAELVAIAHADAIRRQVLPVAVACQCQCASCTGSGPWFGG